MVRLGLVGSVKGVTFGKSALMVQKFLFLFFRQDMFFFRSEAKDRALFCQTRRRALQRKVVFVAELRQAFFVSQLQDAAVVLGDVNHVVGIHSSPRNHAHCTQKDDQHRSCRQDTGGTLALTAYEGKEGDQDLITNLNKVSLSVSHIDCARRKKKKGRSGIFQRSAPLERGLHSLQPIRNSTQARPQTKSKKL